MLDVTNGIDAALVVAGPMPRHEALDHELSLRVKAAKRKRSR